MALYYAFHSLSSLVGILFTLLSQVSYNMDTKDFKDTQFFLERSCTTNIILGHFSRELVTYLYVPWP